MFEGLKISRGWTTPLSDGSLPRTVYTVPNSQDVKVVIVRAETFDLMAAVVEAALAEAAAAEAIVHGDVEDHDPYYAAVDKHIEVRDAFRAHLADQPK